MRFSLSAVKSFEWCILIVLCFFNDVLYRLFGSSHPSDDALQNFIPPPLHPKILEELSGIRSGRGKISSAQNRRVPELEVIHHVEVWSITWLTFCHKVRGRTLPLKRGSILPPGDTRVESNTVARPYASTDGRSPCLNLRSCHEFRPCRARERCRTCHDCRLCRACKPCRAYHDFGRAAPVSHAVPIMIVVWAVPVGRTVPSTIVDRARQLTEPSLHRIYKWHQNETQLILIWF